MARPGHFPIAGGATPSRSAQAGCCSCCCRGACCLVPSSSRSGRRALEEYMRAVRSLVGLLIITLIGSAAFVAHPAATGGTVTVRPGDNLTAIAARAGTTVAALAAANGIRNPDHVEVGQVLKLPTTGAAPEAAI